MRTTRATAKWIFVRSSANRVTRAAVTLLLRRSSGSHRSLQSLGSGYRETRLILIHISLDCSEFHLLSGARGQEFWVCGNVRERCQWDRSVRLNLEIFLALS